MRPEFAEILAEFDGDVREEYSGQGMFGETTSAVVFGSVLVAFAAIAQVSARLADETLADEIYNGEEFDITVDEFIEAVTDFRLDNMGLDIIVY